MEMKREAVVAGMFYPEDKKKLKSQIEDFIKNAKAVEINGKLKGLIVPHAGYIYSGIVAAAGYRLLKDQKRIILVGPSHRVMFEGFASSDYNYWETPLGDVKTIKNHGIVTINEAHDYEHSLEVQLPFLQVMLKDFKILPISVGKADYKKLADKLSEIIEDGIVIVSSDLSHYYPYKTAMKVDSEANKAIPALDVEEAKDIEACGKIGILALMEMAKKHKWKGKLVDYRNSGDTAGSREQVVGYGCYAFYGD
jgi:AmmeMemoRadiSam system protein B